VQRHELAHPTLPPSACEVVNQLTTRRRSVNFP